MERVMGIEPTRLAWEARALPLSYTRVKAILIIHWPFLKVNSKATAAYPDLMCRQRSTSESGLAYFEITLKLTFDALQGIIDRLNMTFQVNGDLLIRFAFKVKSKHFPLEFA